MDFYEQSFESWYDNTKNLWAPYFAIDFVLIFHKSLIFIKQGHSLNTHITDIPLYEGNIQSKLKIWFQARKSHFDKLSINGSS